MVFKYILKAQCLDDYKKAIGEGGKMMFKQFLKSERGDTNFISILIVMGIVILLAGIFIGFKDRIVGMVEDILDKFVIK